MIFIVTIVLHVHHLERGELLIGVDDLQQLIVTI